MSITIVNDYRMKPDFDKRAAMAAARDLAAYRTDHGAELSLWLEDRDDPLHHFHVTVFRSPADLERAREAPEMERFIERYYPHMDTSTHVAPTCDVMLAAGAGVAPVEWRDR